MSHELPTHGIKSFTLAGNATFTVENTATGGRYTFKVQAGKAENAPHFVKVLTGSDNTADYTFLGTIFGEGDFVHSRKSAISREAPSAKAFAWLWQTLRAETPNLRTVRVLHEGRCGRCGRALTVPSSIESGLGPECSQKAG